MGQSKYQEALPYTPVCKNCERIYVTQAVSFSPKNDTVHYKCSGTKLGEKFVKGCGYEGDAKISEGHGKLMWKVEFAARWSAFDIRFEAYGKELTDSVKINDWVAEKALGYPPPYHARYELFQDKSGRKISKSVGNLVTPGEWLDFASPESLRLLMYKRIIGARNISLEDVPTYMDEFDDLEEYYFSKKRDPNQMKDARQKGLYEYTMLLKVPQGKGVHIPYRLLAQLCTVAPPASVEDFVLKRLASYGMVTAMSGDLSRRIGWAAKWSGREGRPPVEAPDLVPPVKKAVEEFAKALLQATDAEGVQNAAFEALKRNGLKPGTSSPPSMQSSSGQTGDRGSGPISWTPAKGQSAKRFSQQLQDEHEGEAPDVYRGPSGPALQRRPPRFLETGGFAVVQETIAESMSRRIW